MEDMVMDSEKNSVIENCIIDMLIILGKIYKFTSKFEDKNFAAYIREISYGFYKWVKANKAPLKKDIEAIWVKATSIEYY